MPYLTHTGHGNKVYQGKDQVRTYWRDVSALVLFGMILFASKLLTHMGVSTD
jgi:hypothetical protein